MKDNTLLYAAIGIGVVYFITRSKTPVPVAPINSTLYPGQTLAPTTTVGTLVPALATLLSKIVPSLNQVPGSNTTPVVLPGNESTNQILIPAPGDSSGINVTPVTLNLPPIDSGSNSPTGQDIPDPDDDDFTSWFDGD